MEETNHAKILVYIAIPVFFVLILMSSIQWWCINDNISKIKNQNEVAYQKIASAKRNGNFKIEYTKLNKKHVLIDPKEINKINEHIDYLAAEVHKESNRAESIIDKDLDRLNLYMAVGIGFMTIFGIFVPLLVNVLSIQDLKEKQKQLLNKFKGVEQKSQKIEALGGKINKLEIAANSISPQLCNLVLQNAIARFFNVSSIVLSNAYKTNSYQYLINLLSAIKSAFSICKVESAHVIVGNENFKHTISDFILFLETEEFRFRSVFNTRAENDEFQKLIGLLAVLKTSTANNEEQNYDNVTGQLDIISNIFSARNATT